MREIAVYRDLVRASGQAGGEHLVGIGADLRMSHRPRTGQPGQGQRGQGQWGQQHGQLMQVANFADAKEQSHHGHRRAATSCRRGALIQVQTRRVEWAISPLCRGGENRQ